MLYDVEVGFGRTQALSQVADTGGGVAVVVARGLPRVRQREATVPDGEAHEVAIGGGVLGGSEQSWQEGVGDRSFHVSEKIDDVGHRALQMNPLRLGGPGQHAIRSLWEPIRGLGKDANEVGPHGRLLRSVSAGVVVIADVTSEVRGAPANSAGESFVFEDLDGQRATALMDVDEGLFNFGEVSKDRGANLPEFFQVLGAGAEASRCSEIVSITLLVRLLDVASTMLHQGQGQDAIRIHRYWAALGRPFATEDRSV